MPQPNKALQTSLTLLTLISFVLMGFTPSHGQETEKPNVLYILADDLGYGEIQAYNPTSGKVPTPNLNRLARQGMMFTDAHSASAVCTPTRYSLLTGRYSWRSRLQSHVIGPNTKPLIKTKFKTLGHLYGSAGYHTAIIGKWHLGYTFSQTRNNQPKWTAPAPVGTEINNGPTTRGFDYFWGFGLSRTMRSIVENDKIIKEIKLEKILPQLAQQGAEYVRAKAQNDQPFFLYLALNSPHEPVVPNEQFKGTTGLNDWADYVAETDWAVGQVLQALHKTGAAENTIVVFASDNGASPNASNVPELERQGYFPSALLRGYKRHIWEGGHRVPFIVRWPGVVEPGSINHNLVSLNDWYATTAELLGIDLPSDQGVDSVSILSLLKGSTDPVRNTAVHHTNEGRFAIRKGDWKLTLTYGSGGWSPKSTISDKKAKKNGWPPIQLYNLKRDIQETNNLQDHKPDKVVELYKTLEQQVRSGRSTPGPKQENAKKVNLWKGNGKARKRIKNLMSSD